MIGIKKIVKKLIWIFKNSRLALYSVFQPLTATPRHTELPVSDLFVWRVSEEWETFFELIDIASLFEPEQKKENYVVLSFFDSKGVLLKKIEKKLMPCQRYTVSIGDLLPDDVDEQGTFSVFHLSKPGIINQFGSYISERGYVSYRYKNAPLRSYVHGNLDAITYDSMSGGSELLGGSGFLSRDYVLQYKLTSGHIYDVGFVNSSSKEQLFVCTVYKNGFDRIESFKYRVKAGGVNVLQLNYDFMQGYRLVIRSKLIMARPLVFCLAESNMDVFHG